MQHVHAHCQSALHHTHTHNTHTLRHTHTRSVRDLGVSWQARETPIVESSASNRVSWSLSLSRLASPCGHHWTHFAGVWTESHRAKPKRPLLCSCRLFPSSYGVNPSDNCRSHAEQTGSCTFLWSVVWTSQWSRRGLELDGAFLCVISTLVERNQTTLRRRERKKKKERH